MSLPSTELATFESFLRARNRDLRRIARGTQGEFTVEDVKQSAWVIAYDIECRGGWPVDFADEDDQNVILGWLYNEHIAYADKANRYALSIDEERENADGELVLARPGLERLLRAPENMGPLALLEAAEQEQGLLDVLRFSYSEAAAYLWLLLRFEWDLQALAADLRVVVVTLRSRMTRALTVFQRQPSLFDGRDAIDPDFRPTRGRQCATKVAVA